MGYACPVCEDPQADAEHLANHLAFTALTGGTDHEAWLDDHVGEWGQLGESELADRVVEHAPETEFPQVFEENVDHDHGDGELPPGAQRGRETGSMSDDDAAVLEAARELTREMLAEDEPASDESDTQSTTEDETQ